ncbi:hypothetical protein PAMP_001357 [Pampus punctatissimus]
MRQKVLQNKPVMEEISDILTDFSIFDKVVAVIVDNEPNMDVAIKRLQFVKLGCFAHRLNLAAQSLYSLTAVTQWTAKICDIIVWMKRSSVTKTALQEKQDLLNLVG